MSGIYYVQKSNLVKASFVSTEVVSVFISLPRSPALSLSHSLASSLPPSLSVSLSLYVCEMENPILELTPSLSFCFSLSPTFVKWKI